ncbi:hypothetical protein F5884DRAFT_515670 [Xylogone sp. PMI_703]|nr:hypothetical protein F5884DRAFT_515670 [Xylogone sp. PMI_703]
MADQCIVCLENLSVVVPVNAATDHEDRQPLVSAVAGPSTESPTTTTSPSNGDIPQPVAVIKPCGHVLHDDCLREWSQKANSCPICRQTFNLVEVLDAVGGVVVSEYAVEDKKQVAEFDQNAWVAENLEEEESNPCPICGLSDNEDVLLLCDACDAPYHTYCIGLDRVPSGHWFCMECASDGAYARAAEPMHPENLIAPPYTGRLCPRTWATVRRARRRTRNDHWYGAWSVISMRVHDAAGLDLDFSDDDQAMSGYRIHQRRTADERREFRRWQQRLNIAGRQGARDAFRNAANPLLPTDPSPLASSPSPTVDPEESRAWGDLEKAKEIDTTSPQNRKRKARSVTPPAGEASTEAPKEPERKLKRPRTRRVLDRAGPSNAGPSNASNSSSHARPDTPSARLLAEVNNEEPSFLSSLLKEVEMATPSEDDTSRSATGSMFAASHRVASPTADFSSPAASPSPLASTYHTPRATSITPPPHISKRSGSPLPLTSRVEPVFPLPDFSPNRSSLDSPQSNHKPDQPHINESSNSTDEPSIQLRQPRPRRQSPLTFRQPRSPETSPARTSMSIEEKEGISKIVKSALSRPWKSAEITKEQYACINRDVSRKLYEMVAGSDAETDRGAWEKIAIQEVARAVEGIATSHA